MRAFQFEKLTGIDGLRQLDTPRPKPGPGQVLIQVHAASLNFRDLLIAKGIVVQNVSLPLIPLSDGAGEVVEIGPGVTRVRTGDRVAGIFMQAWLGGPPNDDGMRSALGGSINGMLAEYCVLSEQSVVHIPEHLSFEEAATLPCAGVTAWNALASSGAVKAGEIVLVQGTGGVSVFALQFAQLLGARVIATSSSDAKLLKMMNLGAFAGINYKLHPNWDAEVLRITKNEGVDHVVDVGGAGTLSKSLNVVRIGGSVSLIGVLTGLEGVVNPVPILLKSIRVQGIYVGSRTTFEDMNRAIHQHKLRPVVDQVFPFEQAREAMKYVDSRAHSGKVVIRM
jgi:NADPH:quinone reductase-like Zn-dependent oxidoreductase